MIIHGYAKALIDIRETPLLAKQWVCLDHKL